MQRLKKIKTNFKKTSLTVAIIATTYLVSGCATTNDQPINNQATSFTQGVALPYQVLNNKIKNGAYPTKNMEIRNGGFGSDAAAHPTNSNQFYALTDRGPNAKYKGRAGKGKQFMTPEYTPRIGLFELQADGQIKLVKEILLKDNNGKPISGLPNPKAVGGTNEIAYDAKGKLITKDPTKPYNKITNPTKTDLYGLDAEGLAVIKDGTFWVSDEYGPHIIHYSANGTELHRINAFKQDARNNVVINGKQILLPAEFAKRRANRGMEGLAITPDQTTLVGIMQSSMDNPNKSGRKTDLTRIVTVNLITGQVDQYLYRQQKVANSNSGIVALSNDEFYIIERDSGFALKNSEAQKHVYKVSLKGATNLEAVLPQDYVKQNDKLGLTIDDQTLEQFIASDSSNWDILKKMGIHVAQKELAIDAVATLNYPHDKLEGLWLRYDGSLGLLNDDDFASWSSNNVLEQKYLDKNKTIEDANRLYIAMPSK